MSEVLFGLSVLFLLVAFWHLLVTAVYNTAAGRFRAGDMEGGDRLMRRAGRMAPWLRGKP